MRYWIYMSFLFAFSLILDFILKIDQVRIGLTVIIMLLSIILQEVIELSDNKKSGKETKS
ncbi:MAG TPA: hypothetical protein DCG77_00495 [Sphingobacterium sp.]|nr:hypothetical protein [Sphingobacterium sp.]